MPTLLIIAFFVGIGHVVIAQHQPVHIPPLSSGVRLRSLDPTRAITEYVHSTWQTKQGLPQNSARALCQTRDGYLWIGTDEGLVRFDGVRFTTFDRSNTPNMSSNIVQALLEDHNGSLWIGTSGGGVIRLQNGVFTTYSTKNGLSNDFVWSLLQAHDGSLWIGTNDGMNRLHFDDHANANAVITTYTTKNGLANNLVLAFLQARDGSLWIGTGSGLSRLRLDNSSNATFTTYSTNNGLSHDFVLSLVEDRDATIWAGTVNGLNHLRLDDHSNITCTRYTDKNGLTANSVRVLLQDRDGVLWIGTRGGGINRFHNGTFAAYTTQNGLSSDDIRSLLQDREGSLWIGTVTGGLNCLRNSMFTSYGIQNSSSNDITSVMQDSKGSLWLATATGGMRRYSYGSNGKVTSKTYTTKEGLPNNFIRALLEDRSYAERTNNSGKNSSKNSGGALWIGTLGGGLSRLRYDEHGNGTFTNYTAKDGLSNNDVLTLLCDADGSLWIGNAQGGINHLKNGVFTTYSTENGLLDKTVHTLLQDRDGTLWIGTEGGLQHFRPSQQGKNAFTNYTTKNGLSNNLIRSLMQDRDGTLWVGTQGGGLHRFKDGKFTAFTTENGLFDNVVFSILEDDFGYLWMSCNKGVYRTNKAALHDFANGKLSHILSESFGEDDGMKNAACNGGSPAGWKDHEGRLWFATGTGIAMVNPRKTNLNPLAPAVIIEEIKADSTALDLRTASTSAVGVEKLEIRYTATSLLSSDRIKFKFLLEGYDKAWTDAVTRRVAYYTNLPRGRHYRFRVIACNNAGVWNEVGAAAMFYLTPYYWETWQFYTLCILFGLSVGYWGVRWRLRWIQARARELEYIVRERTSELSNANSEITRQLEIQAEQAREIEEANVILQDKNLALEQLNKERDESIKELETFSYTIAHDLRTPLRTINSFTQIFLEDYGKSLDSEGQRILQTITGSAAKMSLLIDALLLVSRMGKQIAKPITVNMRGIVQAVLTEMQRNEFLQEYSIELGDLPDTVCDPALIKRVWASLLSNAVKYSRHAESKHITIGSLLQDETIVYFVRDRGAGFDMRHANKLFRMFQRLHKEVDFEGMGVDLSIVHRIIGKHGGKVWAIGALNKGATFYFTLSSSAPIKL